MLNPITARILKYCDMSISALTQLKAWAKRSGGFNLFDPENFSASSLRMATATNARGETVCYAPIETVFMISAFAVAPNVSPEDARLAGDMIDSTIAREAQRHGINKLLLILPKDFPELPEGEWEEVRTYTRKIPQIIGSGGMSCYKPTSLPAAYQN
jgi:hypothetical protein